MAVNLERFWLGKNSSQINAKKSYNQGLVRVTRLENHLGATMHL